MTMKKDIDMPKHRRIISNDDGWIMSNMVRAVTPETIKELMVETYEGSPIDAVGKTLEADVGVVLAAPGGGL